MRVTARLTDRRTDRQNYDSQDRASIAASRSKNQCPFLTIYFLLFFSYLMLPLCSVYCIDDIIVPLKHSGYGTHVVLVFISCTLQVDDIALLSALCYGLQNW